MSINNENIEEIENTNMEPIQGKKSLIFVPKDVSLSDLEETEYESAKDLSLRKSDELIGRKDHGGGGGSEESSGSLDGINISITGGIITSKSQSQLQYEHFHLKGEFLSVDDNQIMIHLETSTTAAIPYLFQYGEYDGEEYKEDQDETIYLEDKQQQQQDQHPKVEIIHVIDKVSQMIFKDEMDLKEFAEYIIKVLEDDVENYFLIRGLSLPNVEPYQFKKYFGSNISLKEEWSELIPSQPSTMRLYYEKGISDFRELSLIELQPGQGIDVMCEANLHRNKLKFRRGVPIKNIDNITQTKEMALIPEELAERTFRQMYPNKDAYKPPLIPSRRSSLNITIETAEKEDGNIDKGRIGPKIKWSSKERLLAPLPDDYYKIETFWTGSIFHGEYIKRQFHHGIYNYPLMATYESEFKEGHIHSRKHLGIITYPRGDTFEGEWRKGRHISGKITFCDDLEFQPRNWDYCATNDRRFYIEHDVGVRQAGRTLYNNKLPPPIIPPGCFDTGDGIYNPKTGEVTGFNGDKLRDATFYEHSWIIENCRKMKEMDERYIQSFNVDRLPCSYIDHYIRQ